MRDLSPIAEPIFTDEDVRKHRIIIDRRERAEQIAREENHRMEHPRTLSEWAAEDDRCDSPPIVERPGKPPTPTTMNRGLGIPKEDEI
jgi:hypothetical protein